MKVLVTGGGGFLGFYVVRDLINAGHCVKSLSRNHYSSLDSLDVETIKCDLTNIDQIKDLNLEEFDAIIHTAAKAGVWGKKEDFFSINFDGTKNLFERAKECRVKYFVYTSSPSVVFGKEDIMLGDEELKYPKRYYTHYAKSKALAEKYVLEGCKDKTMQAVSLRPHLIWGPNDPHLIPRLLDKAKVNRLKQVGNGENLVDIIYVENASCAHVQALEKMANDSTLNGKSYFIGQERPVSLWEFINNILNRNNLPAVGEIINFKTAYYLGFIFEGIFSFFGIVKPEPPMTRFIALQLAKNHYFSHERAKNDFGYSPIYTIDEGLDITFKPLSP